jgi:hypothetical protein
MVNQIQMRNYFLNAGGGKVPTAGASGLANYSELISTAIDFGIQYLTAQSENKKNLELVQRISELDSQQAEKLKKLLNEALTETAKTKVILDFLNDVKIKELEADRKKKRILPLIGLGFGVLLLGIIFYKLNKQNG